MRLVPSVLGIAVLTVVLAGCSSAAPVDEAALHRWEVRERASDDSLLFARVPAGTEERPDVRTAAASASASTSMTFPGPTDLRSVQLACFGDGELEGVLHLRVGAGSSSRPFGLPEAVSCADGRYRFDLPRGARSGVEEIGFTATGSTRDSAWTLHVRTDRD